MGRRPAIPRAPSRSRPRRDLRRVELFSWTGEHVGAVLAPCWPLRLAIAACARIQEPIRRYRDQQPFGWGHGGGRTVFWALEHHVQFVHIIVDKVHLPVAHHPGTSPEPIRAL